MCIVNISVRYVYRGGSRNLGKGSLTSVRIASIFNLLCNTSIVVLIN